MTDPSSANDYPPYQPIDQAENIASKRRVMQIMQQMLDVPLLELNDALRAGYHADATVNLSHPINELSSLDAVAEQF